MPPYILSNQAEVRDGVWLWLLFLANSANLNQSPDSWVPVANGLPLQDEALAVQLRVSARVVRRWRMRLERLGYIRSEVVYPRHRRFWVLNMDPKTEQTPLQAPAPWLM
jgi:hypothetical protein